MKGWVAPCLLLHYNRAWDQLPRWDWAEILPVHPLFALDVIPWLPVCSHKYE